MINTYRNEKHILKELEFGTGDIHCKSLTTDNFVGLGYYQIESGEVGRTIDDTLSKEDFFNEHVQTILKFNNIESLNVTIKNLENLRKYWENKNENN